MKQSTQDLMPRDGGFRGAGRRRRSRQNRRTGIPRVAPNQNQVIPLPEAVPTNPVEVAPPVPLKRRSQRSTRKTALQPAQRPVQRPKSRRPTSPLVHCIRLLISGIGISVIAGSLLAAWDPATRSTSAVQQNPIQKAATPQRATNAGNAASSVPSTSELRVTTELSALKAEVMAMAAQNPGLTPGVFFADLDTGAFLDINGSSSFAAASMIKVPILVAFFQDVDAGKVRLDEILTMRPDQVASGSGTMQYLSPGTQFTALDVATKMIVISDNTATNMLIDRLGGAEALNQRFASWGLAETVIHNRLPDLEGTNLTKPRDLALVMVRVSQGDLVSMRSRDRMLDIMRRTETNTLLPQGIGEDAAIAHKTGDIGSMVGDVGLIDMPNGKRYVAVAMMRRPHNDNRAQELIRQISRSVYRTFTMPPAPPRPAASPTTNPAPSNPAASPTASPQVPNG